MEMAVLCAVAYHQPLDRAGLKDVFGQEVSRDLIDRLRARDLIATAPAPPDPARHRPSSRPTPSSRPSTCATCATSRTWCSMGRAKRPRARQRMGQGRGQGRGVKRRWIGCEAVRSRGFEMEGWRAGCGVGLANGARRQHGSPTGYRPVRREIPMGVRKQSVQFHRSGLRLLRASLSTKGSTRRSVLPCPASLRGRVARGRAMRRFWTPRSNAGSNCRLDQWVPVGSLDDLTAGAVARVESLEREAERQDRD